MQEITKNFVKTETGKALTKNDIFLDSNGLPVITVKFASEGGLQHNYGDEHLNTYETFRALYTLTNRYTEERGTNRFHLCSEIYNRNINAGIDKYSHIGIFIKVKNSENDVLVYVTKTNLLDPDRGIDNVPSFYGIHTIGYIINLYMTIDTFDVMVFVDNDEYYSMDNGKKQADDILKKLVNRDIRKSYMDTEHISISSTDVSGAYPVIPDHVEKAIASKIDKAYEITVVPPKNTVIDGSIKSKTVILYVAGNSKHYPEYIYDSDQDLGEEVINLPYSYAITDMGGIEYQEYKVTIDNPENKDLFFKVFPINACGVYNNDPENECMIADVYGYDIDINDSNPKTRVSYPSYVLNANYKSISIDLNNNEYILGDWENAFFIKDTRPVMLKYNGEVDYELDHNNQRKKLDGSPSDISNDNYEGNAMVEFPKMYFKRWEDSTHQHVRIANYKVDDDYKCYQHMYDGKELEYIYLPMFTPCKVNGRIRSLADKGVLVNKTGPQEKELIEANGPGWQYDDWMNTCMVVDLLFLIGKSTNLQSKFGYGNVNKYHPNITGKTASYGMFFSRNNINQPVKVFYLENYYGDTFKRKYGCVSNSNRSILIKPYPPYSIDTNNLPRYIEVAKFNSVIGGYISKTKMTEYGMIPIEVYGSDSTYVPDYCNCGDTNKFLVWGGDDNSDEQAGMYVKLSYTFSDLYPNVSPSLCYKKQL